MAVKLGGTLAPLGDFPVAEAKHISVQVSEEGTEEKVTYDLQTLIDNGMIGGSGGGVKYVDETPATFIKGTFYAVEWVDVTGD